jgi:cytochrome c oxidase cbb3-type subunit 1
MAYNVYRTVSAKNNSLELDEQAQLA